VKTLLRLPGNHCRHYCLGHCLQAEHANPGYHAGHTCRVVVHLCQAYDAFLKQADAFDLKEATAWDIWRKRFAVLASQETGCQDHKPGGRNEFPDCAHAQGDVCLLALPACQGQCPDFRPHQEQNQD
jgi:hypothetical protein